MARAPPSAAATTRQRQVQETSFVRATSSILWNACTLVPLWAHRSEIKI
jgi:hypothetical protein